MTIRQALDLVAADYRVKRKRDTKMLPIRTAHLCRLFPVSEPLESLTTAMLLTYADARQGEKVGGATINREIALLRRCYTLGRVVWPVPDWEKLPESEPRQGRIDGALYAAILAHLVPKYQVVARFLYYTGWRVKEALGQRKDEVSLAANRITLPAERSKNRKRSTIPMIPQLRALVEAQLNDPVRSEYICHHENGDPISYNAFKVKWDEAREAAGAPAAIPHDFRRTTITKLVKELKLTRRTAMKFSHHASENAFIRYEVEDDTELAENAESFGRLLDAQQPPAGLREDVSGVAPRQ